MVWILSVILLACWTLARGLQSAFLDTKSQSRDVVTYSYDRGVNIPQHFPHKRRELKNYAREEFTQLNSSQCISAVHLARAHGGAPRGRRIHAHMRPGRRQTTTSTTMRGLALALLAATARAGPPSDC